MSNNGNDKHYLDFMYDKICVPRMMMFSWLQVDDFRIAVEEKIDQNITIDDKVIYEIIKAIYFPERYEREVLKLTKEWRLNHYVARRGLRILSDKLFKSKDFWTKEYDEYLKTRLFNSSEKN